MNNSRCCFRKNNRTNLYNNLEILIGYEHRKICAEVLVGCGARLHIHFFILYPRNEQCAGPFAFF